MGIYPNPAHTEITVDLTVERPTEINISIYDLRGRLIRTLQRGLLAAGSHLVTWKGRDQRGAAVGSGVYLCRMVADDYAGHLKLVLLK